jgi:hypothetical protein
MASVPGNLNSDQVFSVARQIMTVFGAVVLGSLETNLQTLIIGVIPISISVIWSLWRNVDNGRDMVFSGMRQALLMVGAYAAARGWLSDQQVQYFAGAAFTLISSVMSFWFYRDAPGPLLPGTTIVDEPSK